MNDGRLSMDSRASTRTPRTRSTLRNNRGCERGPDEVNQSAGLCWIGGLPGGRKAARTLLTPNSSATGARNGGVEPTLGFEPRTCCLRNSCSTAELCRRCSSIGAARRHQLFAGVGARAQLRAKRWHSARTADDYCQRSSEGGGGTPCAPNVRSSLQTTALNVAERSRPVVVSPEAMALTSLYDRRELPNRARDLRFDVPHARTRKRRTACSVRGARPRTSLRAAMRPGRVHPIGPGNSCASVGVNHG
jgi:hypothetical protein